MTAVAHHSADDGLDQFIPIRKSDILDALLKQGAFESDAEREKFRRLCDMLASIYHYKYFGQLERLRNDYYYFSPDVAPHAAMDRASNERAMPTSCNPSTGAQGSEFPRSAPRRDRRRPPAPCGTGRGQGATARFPRGSLLPERPAHRAIRGLRMVRPAQAQGRSRSLRRRRRHGGDEVPCTKSPRGAN